MNSVQCHCASAMKSGRDDHINKKRIVEKKRKTQKKE